MGTWMAIGIAAACAAPPAGTLPDVFEHLFAARVAASSGWMHAAKAHTDLFLFPQGLTVRMDLDAVCPPRRERARRVLIEAAGWWEQALHRPGLFVWTDGDAPVCVRLVRRIPGASGDVGGWTRWLRTVTTSGDEVLERSFEADIQVRWLPEAAMRHVAAHELGHILGLADSVHVGDVMGPVDLRHPADRLSDADEAALAAVQTPVRDVPRPSAAGVPRV